MAKTKQGKKDDPALVQAENWNKVIVMVGRDGWDLSMREVCQILKCSRNWALQYVRPNVRHIYIPTGYATQDGQPYHKNTDWSVLLRWRVRENYGEEKAKRIGTASLFFNRQEFWEFIAAHGTWFVRTKRVDCTKLISKKDQEELAKDFAKALKQADKDGKNEFEQYINRRRAEKVHAANLVNASYIEKEGISMPAGRASTPWVEIDAPKKPWRDLNTAASMTDWGEAPEEVYRRIHMSGMWRFEIKLPDINGEVGRKVLYLQDPEPVVDLSRAAYTIDWFLTPDGGYYVTITWKEWLRLKPLYET